MKNLHKATRSNFAIDRADGNILYCDSRLEDGFESALICFVGIASDYFSDSKIALFLGLGMDEVERLRVLYFERIKTVRFQVKESLVRRGYRNAIE